MDKPPNMTAVNRRRQEIAKQAKIERMYNILLRYYTLLDRYKIRFALKTPDDEIYRRFVYALQNIGYAEYMLEAWGSFDKEQQEEIKPEVDRIEREYKRILDEWGE